MVCFYLNIKWYFHGLFVCLLLFVCSPSSTLQMSHTHIFTVCNSDHRSRSANQTQIIAVTHWMHLLCLAAFCGFAAHIPCREMWWFSFLHIYSCVWVCIEQPLPPFQFFIPTGLCILHRYIVYELFVVRGEAEEVAVYITLHFAVFTLSLSPHTLCISVRDQISSWSTCHCLWIMQAGMPSTTMLLTPTKFKLIRSHLEVLVSACFCHLSLLRPQGPLENLSVSLSLCLSLCLSRKCETWISFSCITFAFKIMLVGSSLAHWTNVLLWVSHLALLQPLSKKDARWSRLIAKLKTNILLHGLQWSQLLSALEAS